MLSAFAEAARAPEVFVPVNLWGARPPGTASAVMMARPIPPKSVALNFSHERFTAYLLSAA
ncbi:MAG: hypothetical protein HY231_25075 [Acidobacteria bacterium]|nr:hypothetical protein [Acidobacteriota bacterium]